MLKVLLVDDESLALDYMIKLIDWETMDLELAGTAKNGRQALEHIHLVTPDIVISDIRMAVMDGLELARQVRKTDPRVKFILISAHRDFEYAQKGIQYGVTSYLLKHELTRETLNRQLRQVIGELEEEQGFHMIYRENFIKKVIFSHEITNEDNIVNRFGNRFFMILLHRERSLLEETEVQFDQLWLQDTKNVILAYCDQVPELSYFTDIQISPENLLLVLALKDFVSQQRIGERIFAVMDLLLQQGRCGNNPIAVLASEETNYKSMSSNFRMLSNGIRYSMFMKRWKGYFLYELPLVDEPSLIRLDSFYETIERHDFEDIDDLLYLLDTLRSPVWQLSALKEVTPRLLLRMKQVDRKLYKELQKPIYKIEELLEFLRLFAEERKKLYISPNGEHYTALTVKILSYLKQHYTEEITLHTLGEQFEMNGVYLNRCFKKEVGTSVLKYVTYLRMEHAKRLLSESNDSVSEVAEAVGYRTGQYFSQIFSKNTGMTPQEYKKWGDVS